jgi:hypothetical protein
MKKLFLLLIVLYTVNQTFAQVPCKIAYHDALVLNNYIKNGSFLRDIDSVKDTTEKVASVLIAYLNNHAGIELTKLKGNEVLSELNQKASPNYNPFLAPYINTSDFAANEFKNSISTYSKSLTGTLGGLDVTNIADGLARFLVKRTKEELNVAFFSKFKTTLNEPAYRDLRTLFPDTWELLDAIGDEIYDYNKYLLNLREAFQSDIKTLDENLPGIITNHKEFFNDHFKYAASLNSACYISTSLRNNIHPGDIIDLYPLDSLKKRGKKEPNYKNWSGAIQTLQLISESLRDISSKKDNYWVTYEQVKELVNDKDAFQIYLGLIYQVAKNNSYDSIAYKEGSFVKMLDKIAPQFDENYSAYKNYISNFVIKIDAINKMVKEYSKPAKDSIAFENYAKYFKASVDLIEYCTEVSKLPGFKETINVSLEDSLEVYFRIINSATDLAIAINRKNYSAAINHTVSIYNLVRTKVLEKEQPQRNSKKDSDPITNKEKRAVKKYLKSYNKLLEDKAITNKILKEGIDNTFKKIDSESKGKADAAITDEISKDTLKKAQDLLSKLARYGSFMASVATAKTSEEVSNAIEAAALPTGSSRIKRETPLNVSLNAYTGFFGGWENIIGFDDKFTFNSYGLTAPIGVAISTGSRKLIGMPCNKDGHWSYSAFLSLIDIGTVAAFRFQNDTVDQVPTISLQDIFSPGLFFSLGIPKCPLSINMGAQVGPNLRKIYSVEDEETGELIYQNQYQNNVYWRVSISVVVDIPILNFYTKSK